MTALSQNETKEVDCTPVRFTAKIWKMYSFKKYLLELTASFKKTTA